MTGSEAYRGLVARSRDRALLASSLALLSWDEQTYLPSGGAEYRAEATAQLAGLLHDRASAPEIADLIGLAESSAAALEPDSPESVNLREWRRDHDRSRKRPRRLVESLAAVTSIAQSEWAEARKARDFERFRPRLSEIVELKRQEAACLGDGPSDYGALLDEYEPGLAVEDLPPLFEAIRKDLGELARAIASATVRPDRTILDRSYPVDRQRLLGETIAAAVGFDFRRGRIDEAAHPFCTGLGPHDCRITTRYDPRDFSGSFFGVLHETGHALYEQGLDPRYVSLPMGEAASLGVHESQSRLWENGVGRSPAFWRYADPLVRRFFPGTLDDVEPDALLTAINAVEPSLVRVEADEVTYNLHVSIRFHLESAMIAGDLPVRELPVAWAEAYRDALGVVPDHDGEGCLQDVHWAAGLFGYFPTYTIGNVLSAQLQDAAAADLGDLDDAHSRGEFRPLLDWLRAKVHRQGRRHPASTLPIAVAGGPLDPSGLVESLKSKYQRIYKL